MVPNILFIKVALVVLTVYCSCITAQIAEFKLEGNGCEKLNIIPSNLLCSSEGAFPVAGTCDQYVKCMKEKTGKHITIEPYMHFCAGGENFVRGNCSKNSDAYDCPQSHCKWVAAGKAAEAPVSTSTSSAAGPNPAGLNVETTTVRNGQVSNGCNEKEVFVNMEEAETCPLEGKYPYAGDCELYVKCECNEGSLATVIEACNEGEIFLGNECTKSADKTCPQQKCPEGLVSTKKHTVHCKKSEKDTTTITTTNIIEPSSTSTPDNISSSSTGIKAMTLTIFVTILTFLV